MRFRLRKAIFFVVPVWLMVALASADTLEMKDRRIKGKYMGGTITNIRFRVDGRIELYPVSDIVALTFDAEGHSDSGTGIGAGAGSALSDRGSASEGSTVIVPAGMRVLVQMIDSIDSEKNKVGDRFRATLEQDLVIRNMVVAQKGSDVYGQLAESKEPRRVSGKSELKLELTDIVINGRMQPVVTGGYYSVSGHSRGTSTAHNAGGGAVLGAAIGAIADSGKGAAIEASVGADSGTAASVMTRGEQVRIPSETMLEFRIERSFTIEMPASIGR